MNFIIIAIIIIIFSLPSLLISRYRDLYHDIYKVIKLESYRAIEL